MSLKVVHKNKKPVSKEKDAQVLSAEEQIMNEIREHFRKKAYKKYGVKLQNED